VVCDCGFSPLVLLKRENQHFCFITRSQFSSFWKIDWFWSFRIWAHRATVVTSDPIQAFLSKSYNSIWSEPRLFCSMFLFVTSCQADVPLFILELSLCSLCCVQSFFSFVRWFPHQFYILFFKIFVQISLNFQNDRFVFLLQSLIVYAIPGFLIAIASLVIGIVFCICYGTFHKCGRNARSPEKHPRSDVIKMQALLISISVFVAYDDFKLCS
jgi:hypothetical protein